MAASNTNNTANVSAGKGVAGGYIFAAPVGTELPTTLVTSASDLDPAFKCLGFISEEGYAESTEADSNDLSDMSAVVMDTTYGAHVHSAQFTLAEIKADTLKVQYGPDNVTDSNGVITVKHNSNCHPTFSYVLLFELKEGRLWTKVVPNGRSDALDTLTVVSTELCQRPITIKYLTDANGQAYYDYFESTETDAA